MAFVPLSVQWSLVRVRSAIRTQIGKPSSQGKPTDAEINDLVHAATLEARTAFDSAIGNQYVTNETVTESALAIDISAFSIFDMRSLVLNDSNSTTDVPVVSMDVLNGVRKMYGTLLPTDTLLAAVSNIDPAVPDSGKQTITVLRGTSVATPGTMTVRFRRNPRKPAADTEMLDLPDHVVPAVIAAVTANMMTGKPITGAFNASTQ